MNMYQNEIEQAISSYENGHPQAAHNLDWICSRMDDCWQKHQISRVDMESLVDRVINIVKRNI